MIVMTPAAPYMYKNIRGEPATPQRIADETRFGLQAVLDGHADGIVPYRGSLHPGDPYLQAVADALADWDQARKGVTDDPTGFLSGGVRESAIIGHGVHCHQLASSISVRRAISRRQASRSASTVMLSSQRWVCAEKSTCLPAALALAIASCSVARYRASS